MNSEGVLTPGAYFRQKNPGNNRFRKASEKNGWTAASVLNILHQYEYTGALVGRKRYKASLHEKRTVAQDKADWIICEGAHDAIISKADFDRIQEIIQQRNTPSRGTPNSYPLKGLLKCGNCHRTLSRVHNSAGYYYENFNAGELTKDAYLKQRTEIDSKIASAKAEQGNQEQLLSELERLAVQDKAQEDDVFISYAGATELTAELAGTFIKEILVSSPTEIKIVWKFRDVFNFTIKRMPGVVFRGKTC